MDALVVDLRRAVRLLRASPGLLLVGVLSLGLGIGVNLTIFTAIRAVFFHVPTLAGADRVIAVQPGNSNQLSYPNYVDLRESGIFDALAGYRRVPLIVRAGGVTERVDALVVTPDFFDAVRVPFALGRAFGAREATAEGEPRLVVVSHAFWRSRFSASSDAVGSTVMLNGEPFTVVGVLPESYRPVTSLEHPDVYVPISRLVLPTVDDRRNGNALTVLAWLRDDMTREQAQAAVGALGAALEQQYPAENANMGQPARVFTLAARDFGESPIRLAAPAVLLTLFSVVLLSACANVAGLLLARATQRQHEMAVRTALGARRAQLVRMLLAESFTLASGGALAGMLLALALMRVLSTLVLPGAGVLNLALEPDLTLAAYALLLLAATGLLCGMAPGWRAARTNVVAGIQAGESHTATGRLRLRHAFVVGQVAACAILLVLSSLLLRDLLHITSMDPGFDADRGVVARVYLDADRYARDGGLLLGERLLERLRTLPGVEAVGMANIVALGGDDGSATRLQTDRQPDASASPRTFVNSVSPGYFATLGIPILRGRDFDARDREGNPAVAIVTQAFAEAYFPGEEALGRGVQHDDTEPYAEIVGIVADHKYQSYGEAMSPILYSAYAQRPRVSTQVRPLVVHVRTGGEPAALLPEVERTIAALDAASAADVVTLRAAVGIEPAFRRLGSQLLGAAGALALLLAAIGLYGMMAFAVASREREIGVRMALGASTGQILRGVLVQGLRLVATGLVIGFGVSLLAAPLLSLLLAGVSAADPLSYAGAALVLVLVGLAACWLPARHAARVVPLATLRRL